MRNKTSALLACIALSTIAGVSADAVEPAALFNGRDLTGWTAHFDTSDVRKEDVWSVKDGVLVCKGRPAGYLMTKKNDNENYLLTLQWRWPKEGGNNGVLIHINKTVGVIGVWPRCLEVQLASGEAGDFWVIGTKIEIENPEGRIEGRRHKNLTDGSEKPLGEWNKMEITCRGDEVTVKVNGELVNHATKLDQSKGAIALQSEGTPIEFRDIKLTPLKKQN